MLILRDALSYRCLFHKTLGKFKFANKHKMLNLRLLGNQFGTKYLLEQAPGCTFVHWCQSRGICLNYQQSVNQLNENYIGGGATRIRLLRGPQRA